MAKVKRSVLKEIVKECLLEILFEGIDSEPGYEEEPIREARQPRSRASRPSNRNKPTSQSPADKKQLQEEYVNNMVGGLTQDPIMASIYADTAQTTLQEQRENRMPSADNAAAVVDNVDDMSQIFEGANNWAAIAFADGE